jgi:hypothetical protein
MTAQNKNRNETKAINDKVLELFRLKREDILWAHKVHKHMMHKWDLLYIS